MSSALEVLRQLEAKYLSALEKVREIIRLESPESSSLPMPSTVAVSAPATAPVKPETPIDGHSPPAGEFAAMTKANAAYAVLKEKGIPLHRNLLFDFIKAKGHPVKDVKSLMVALSADPGRRFKSIGDGNWTLTKSKTPISEISRQENALSASTNREEG